MKRLFQKLHAIKGEGAQAERRQVFAIGSTHATIMTGEVFTPLKKFIELIYPKLCFA
jgi:hypothetical protein